MPACSAPSSSPIPTSPCSKRWPAIIRARWSWSSLPQDHPRGLGDAFLRARTIWPARHSWRCCRTICSTDPTPPPRSSGYLSNHRPGNGAPGRDRSEGGGLQGRDRPGGGAEGTRRQPSEWSAVADKGAGRFDTAGEEAAVTPIGRMAFPADICDEFEEVGRETRTRAWSWTTCRCCSAWPGGTRWPGSSARPILRCRHPEGYRDAVAALPARV